MYLLQLKWFHNGWRMDGRLCRGTCRDRYIFPSLSHSAHTTCTFFLCLHGAVPVDVPEEPLDELLLLRLSIVEDGNGDGGGVVLVFRQADGGDLLGGLLIGLGAVEGLRQQGVLVH